MATNIREISPNPKKHDNFLDYNPNFIGVFLD